MRINDFNKYGEHANYHLNVRLTKNQRIKLGVLADAAGFNTIASYVRFMLFNPMIDMKLNQILEIVKKLQEK